LSNDNGSTINVTGHTSPSHGTVVVQASGSYTYTPAAGYSGPDTFTYTITDAYGRTAATTVTIQVTPVAKPDSATTPMGIPVTINSLTNDTGTQLTLTATTQPAHGSVSITNNQLVYTPPAGFTGISTFTYTATDASGQSVITQVTVTVGPAFGPPISTGTGSGSGSTGSTASGGHEQAGDSTSAGEDPAGSLPYTGAEVVPTLAVSVVLLMCGVCLRLVGGRRRRITART
jgi:hypothetical protein